MPASVHDLTLGRLELASLALRGPLDLAALAKLQPAAAGSWNLAPLAAAQGTVQGKITDAHLSFDADVTVPIQSGGIDFNRATVEHVGPDSLMGVSKMGLYVDAPNGRSYLYQFPATPVAGVEFERRGVGIGPWAVSERGKLQLQPFVESLLRQPVAGHGPAFTEQAKLLLDRTSVSGFVQLGDGAFALPGVSGELTGASVKANLLRLHAEAVGRGITLEIAALHARRVVLQHPLGRVACEDVTGSLVLRLRIERGAMHYEVDLSKLAVAGVRLDPA